MIVYIDESPPGTGKTRRVVEKAATHNARWLFAVERHQALEDLQQRILSVAQEHGTAPEVVVIKSSQALRGYSVRQKVEALPSNYGRAGHVIALCTHAGLLMSDLREFHDWHVVIDEVPTILSTEEIGSQLDEPFLRNHFTLEHVHGQWSKVGLTDAGRRIDGSLLSQDDSHRHLRMFYRRVAASERCADRHVVCNLRAWKDVAQPKLKWTWWNYFSVRELSAFRSIEFLGNAFTKSFSAKLWRERESGVEWRVSANPGQRKLEHRRVTVSYFSDRPASKNLFASNQGAQALAEIGRHIATGATGKLIWSANSECAAPLAQHLSKHTHLSPRQAGADCWMDHTRAAIMFAAKPSPSMRGVLEALGVQQQDWVASNEYETILQFVTRTSIRDVASREHAFVYVFDRDQADYLMDFFAEQPHIDADVQRVDLALDLSPKKSGRKPRSLTPEEVKARKEQRNSVKAASARKRRREIAAADMR